jgi:chromosome segregation ATPase
MDDIELDLANLRAELANVDAQLTRLHEVRAELLRKIRECEDELMDAERSQGLVVTSWSTADHRPVPTTRPAPFPVSRDK